MNSPVSLSSDSISQSSYSMDSHSVSLLLSQCKTPSYSFLISCKTSGFFQINHIIFLTVR